MLWILSALLAPVQFTEMDGGHPWPGGAVLPESFLGKTIEDFDATAEMWRFFEQHPRRSGRTVNRHDSARRRET